ncbi:hypothetical protein WG66_010882, partial [Moniliophthora roreri]
MLTIVYRDRAQGLFEGLVEGLSGTWAKGTGRVLGQGDIGQGVIYTQYNVTLWYLMNIYIYDI